MSSLRGGTTAAEGSSEGTVSIRVMYRKSGLIKTNLWPCRWF
ncbi:MAG TPA: hypothetical protein PKA53_03485 [Sphingobacterium sp.]|nr:hypothetical protein [Sphingobacterium sp.]